MTLALGLFLAVHPLSYSSPFAPGVYFETGLFSLPRGRDGTPRQACRRETEWAARVGRIDYEAYSWRSLRDLAACLFRLLSSSFFPLSHGPVIGLAWPSRGGIELI